jgi:hypothetical protein
MTPEMMIQLVMEDDFDPQEIERVAQGDLAEIETRASDGGTLRIVPQREDRFERILLGTNKIRGFTHHYDIFHQSETPLGPILKHVGSIHHYDSWPATHWSLSLNRTYYDGPSEIRHISAPNLEQAAVRMWNIVLNNRAKPQAG